jgi:galactokinase
VRAFWAPGRLNLIGEFTDYSGGLVLPVALDLGIRIDAEAAERTLLSSDARPGTSADGGWGRYVSAVEAELAALERPPVGIEGTVHSTLPIGAGLSSSAALEVAVAIALCAVAGFPVEPLELALAAQRAELRAVGVPCGIMDQAASVLGRAGHAILLDTGTLAYEHIPLPPQVALVVVDSGISRRLESSAYAERRRELEAGHPARVRHVESENERVRAVTAILREPGQPRLRELGALFAAGHESLRTDFEVTIPELDLLVALAVEAGALAARMTGGGFGGSIVALVEHTQADVLAQRVLAEYRRRAGGKCVAYVCAASDGARELT